MMKRAARIASSVCFAPLSHFLPAASDYGASLTPADEAMANAVIAHWVAFVKSGKPEVAAGLRGCLSIRNTS
jgi:hypothetical protein